MKAKPTAPKTSGTASHHVHTVQPSRRKWKAFPPCPHLNGQSVWYSLPFTTFLNCLRYLKLLGQDFLFKEKYHFPSSRTLAVCLKSCSIQTTRIIKAHCYFTKHKVRAFITIRQERRREIPFLPLEYFAGGILESPGQLFKVLRVGPHTR